MRSVAIIKSTARINFGEIRYFHPSGRITLPNGHPIQKGGFLRECRINSNSIEPSLCSGYCIVLPSNLQEITHDDVNVCINDSNVRGSSVTYTIGNFFKGRYINGSGEIFNNTSIAIGIKEIPTEKLIKLIECISKRLSINRVLIKDFSNHKIFIAIANAHAPEN